MQSANQGAFSEVRSETATEKPQDIDLITLLEFLWVNKFIITLCMLLGIGLSILNAFSQPRLYASEALLAPAPSDSPSNLGTLAGQFSPLELLGGQRNNGGNTSTAVAILTSFAFFKELDQTENLVEEIKQFPSLMRDLFGKAGGEQQSPEVQARRAWLRFRGLQSIRINPKEGTVVVSMTWPDPARAAALVNLQVAMINKKMREEAIREAEAKIRFLTEVMQQGNAAPVSQSIYALTQSEMQRRILAEGRSEFTFKIIDPATAPDKPASPKRRLIALLGLVLGGIVGVGVALVRLIIRAVIHRQRRGPPLAAAVSAGAP